MQFKKAVALILIICIVASLFVSCKKENDLLHTELLGLDEKCDHFFTEVEKTEENCIVSTHYQCNLCSGLKYEYHTAKGHRVTFIPGKTASCCSNGYTNGIYCATCDITHSEKKLVPLRPNAHLFVEKEEPASLFTGGGKVSSCLFCKKTEVLSVSDKVLPPEEAGVPVLFFEGELDESTKEKPVNMTVKYQSNNLNFSAYCTMKVQGNTSTEYEKKNYNIKLYKDEAHSEKYKIDFGWGKEFKFCLKANYIDASHARNIVNARLFAKLSRERTGHNPRLDDLPNMGTIDGFPVALYLDGEFYGMYTLNIPKDKWLMGMKDDETVREAILTADDWQSSVFLEEPIAVDYSNGWELEHCTTQDSAWVRNSFNDFIEFVNQNNGESLKQGLPKYIDVDSFIDTMLFYCIIGAYDNYVKNMLYVTYDGGETWMCIPYDLDSTWGLSWDGSHYLQPDKGIPQSTSNGGVLFKDASANILWPKLMVVYKEKIKTRYHALRNGVLSNENIKSEYNAFFDSVPEILYRSEAQKWPNIPQQKVNQKNQIFSFMEARTKLIDEFMNSY